MVKISVFEIYADHIFFYIYDNCLQFFVHDQPSADIITSPLTEISKSTDPSSWLKYSKVIDSEPYFLKKATTESQEAGPKFMRSSHNSFGFGLFLFPFGNCIILLTHKPHIINKYLLFKNSMQHALKNFQYNFHICEKIFILKRQALTPTTFRF